MIEVYLITKAKLDVVRQQMHAPRQVEFSSGVVVIHSWSVASGPHRQFDLLKSVAYKGAVKAFHCCFVVVVKHILQRLLAADKGVLHLANRLFQIAFFSFVSPLQLLHLGDENIVALFLDEMISLDTLRYLQGEVSSFFGLFEYIGLCSVDTRLYIQSLLF